MTPAECHSYDQVIDAFRARAAELLVSCETMEMGSGLPKGYPAKLLAKPAIKGLGRVSLGPMLWVLGLKIIVAEDPVAYANFTAHLDRKKQQFASTGMRQRQRRANTGNSQWGKTINAWRTLKLTRRERSRSARIAANARWANRA